MPFYTQSDVARARELDLLTYLQTYEPDELVKISSRVYSTRMHDSLKISNGKWMWWSRGVGGRNALEYLIAIQGLNLYEAVHRILGKNFSVPNINKSPSKTEPKVYQKSLYAVNAVVRTVAEQLTVTVKRKYIGGA